MASLTGTSTCDSSPVTCSRWLRATCARMRRSRSLGAMGAAATRSRRSTWPATGTRVVESGGEP
eukprot:5628012-Alexandrium_andersonii.AAC.1